MNDVAHFFDSVYNTVMYLAPGFIWVLITFLICWLSYLFGVKHSDYIWKNNIKYHMPKVTKDEIETRDKKINQLSYKYRTLKTEYDKMANVVNAMKGIAGVMDEGKK